MSSLREKKQKHLKTKVHFQYNIAAESNSKWKFEKMFNFTKKNSIALSRI